MDNKQRLTAIERKIDTVLNHLGLEKLHKCREEVKEEKKWPQVGDEYYWHCSEGLVHTGAWHDEHGDREMLKAGSLYKTKAQAQAVIDLKKDIFRFDMPKGKTFMCLHLDYSETGDSPFSWYSSCSNLDLIFLASWKAGIHMPENATEEDRERRIELLEKVHNG